MVIEKKCYSESFKVQTNSSSNIFVGPKKPAANLITEGAKKSNYQWIPPQNHHGRPLVLYCFKLQIINLASVDLCHAQFLGICFLRWHNSSFPLKCANCQHRQKELLEDK